MSWTPVLPATIGRLLGTQTGALIVTEIGASVFLRAATGSTGWEPEPTANTTWQSNAGTILTTHSPRIISTNGGADVLLRTGSQSGWTKVLD